MKIQLLEDNNCKNSVRKAILDILTEKRANGDVLPYAMSIEVAHVVHMDTREVEEIARGIEGIVIGETLNGEYYYE